MQHVHEHVEQLRQLEKLRPPDQKAHREQVEQLSALVDRKTAEAERLGAGLRACRELLEGERERLARQHEAREERAQSREQLRGQAGREQAGEERRWTKVVVELDGPPLACGMAGPQSEAGLEVGHAAAAVEAVGGSQAHGGV